MAKENLSENQLEMLSYLSEGCSHIFVNGSTKEVTAWVGGGTFGGYKDQKGTLEMLQKLHAAGLIDARQDTVYIINDKGNEALKNYQK